MDVSLVLFTVATVVGGVVSTGFSIYQATPGTADESALALLSLHTRDPLDSSTH